MHLCLLSLTYFHVLDGFSRNFVEIYSTGYYVNVLLLISQIYNDNMAAMQTFYAAASLVPLTLYFEGYVW